MVLDAESVVDRRRLKRRLTAWRIAAVVLAAGLSSRMGSNKLLAEWRGKSLLRWTIESALASEARNRVAKARRRRITISRPEP